MFCAFLVCACHKAPEPTLEPTYQSRTMSEWAQQAADLDDSLRDKALCALAEFKISTGTKDTIKILDSIAAGHSKKDHRGAAIALADWLRPIDDKDLSRERSHPREIPFVFATIVAHYEDPDWQHMCSLCAIYLGNLHNDKDFEQVHISAEEFNTADVATQQMRTIFDAHARQREAEARARSQQ